MNCCPRKFSQKNWGKSDEGGHFVRTFATDVSPSCSSPMVKGTPPPPLSSPIFRYSGLLSHHVYSLPYVASMHSPTLSWTFKCLPDQAGPTPFRRTSSASTLPSLHVDFCANPFLPVKNDVTSGSTRWSSLLINTILVSPSPPIAPLSETSPRNSFDNDISFLISNPNFDLQPFSIPSGPSVTPLITVSPASSRNITMCRKGTRQKKKFVDLSDMGSVFDLDSGNFFDVPFTILYE